MAYDKLKDAVGEDAPIDLKASTEDTQGTALAQDVVPESEQPISIEAPTPETQVAPQPVPPPINDTPDFIPIEKAQEFGIDTSNVIRKQENRKQFEQAQKEFENNPNKKVQEPDFVPLKDALDTKKLRSFYKFNPEQAINISPLSPMQRATLSLATPVMKEKKMKEQFGEDNVIRHNGDLYARLNDGKWYKEDPSLGESIASNNFFNELKGEVASWYAEALRTGFQETGRATALGAMLATAPAQLPVAGATGGASLIAQQAAGAGLGRGIGETTVQILGRLQGLRDDETVQQGYMKIANEIGGGATAQLIVPKVTELAGKALTTGARAFSEGAKRLAFSKFMTQMMSGMRGVPQASVNLIKSMASKFRELPSVEFIQTKFNPIMSNATKAIGEIYRTALKEYENIVGNDAKIKIDLYKFVEALHNGAKIEGRRVIDFVNRRVIKQMSPLETKQVQKVFDAIDGRDGMLTRLGARLTGQGFGLRVVAKKISLENLKRAIESIDENMIKWDSQADSLAIKVAKSIRYQLKELLHSNSPNGYAKADEMYEGIMSMLKMVRLNKNAAQFETFFKNFIGMPITLQKTLFDLQEKAGLNFLEEGLAATSVATWDELARHTLGSLAQVFGNKATSGLAMAFLVQNPAMVMRALFGRFGMGVEYGAHLASKFVPTTLAQVLGKATVKGQVAEGTSKLSTAIAEEASKGIVPQAQASEALPSGAKVTVANTNVEKVGTLGEKNNNPFNLPKTGEKVKEAVTGTEVDSQGFEIPIGKELFKEAMEATMTIPKMVRGAFEASADKNVTFESIGKKIVENVFKNIDKTEPVGGSIQNAFPKLNPIASGLIGTLVELASFNITRPLHELKTLGKLVRNASLDGVLNVMRKSPKWATAVEELASRMNTTLEVAEKSAEQFMKNMIENTPNAFLKSIEINAKDAFKSLSTNQKGTLLIPYMSEGGIAKFNEALESGKYTKDELQQLAKDLVMENSLRIKTSDKPNVETFANAWKHGDIKKTFGARIVGKDLSSLSIFSKKDPSLSTTTKMVDSVTSPYDVHADISNEVKSIEREFPQMRGAGKIPSPVSNTRLEMATGASDIDWIEAQNPDKFPRISGNPIKGNPDYGHSFDPDQTCEKGATWTVQVLTMKDQLRKFGINDPKILTAASRKMLEAGFQQKLETPCAICYKAEKILTGYSAPKKILFGSKMYERGMVDGIIEDIRKQGNILRGYSIADFKGADIISLLGLGEDLARHGSGFGVYVKNLNFLEIFGDVGFKGNISSGSNNRMGIPLEIAKIYRKRYPNFGIEYTARTEADLHSAGEDPMIDKIIPAHLGGGTPEKWIKDATGFEVKNWSGVQSETIDGVVLHSKALDDKYGKKTMDSIRYAIKRSKWNSDPKEYLSTVKSASDAIKTTIMPMFDQYKHAPWYYKLIGTGGGEYGQTARIPKIDMSRTNFEKAKEYLKVPEIDKSLTVWKYGEIAKKIIDASIRGGKEAVNKLDARYLSALIGVGALASSNEDKKSS